jgi:hypothetical protein
MNNSEIYTTELAFKGVKCVVQIITSFDGDYELLIKANKKLSKKDRESLNNYLFEEGYIDEAIKHNSDLY